MRISVLTSLYPIPALPFEGIFAARRWEAMAQRGHDIRVLAPTPWAPLPIGPYRDIAGAPRHETRSGIPVHRPRYLHIPKRALPNAKRFAKLALKHLDPKTDVVVCDYAWPASMIAPALQQTGVACVINGRGSDVLQVMGEADLKSHLASNLKAAGNWCAVSQDLVDAMDGLAGAEGHGLLVPNGVDSEHFAPGDRVEARQRLGLASGCPLVLVVGHLIQRKDPLLGLNAFAQGAPADARLCFVGRGPLADALKAETDRLGLQDRIQLAGERPPEELLHWYRAADLVMLTSTREGRPNVVLEALSCGTPVLATRAGGTGELLPDARFLSESRDPIQLGSMLADLLNNPPASAELRAIAEPLSWESSIQTLEACLERARSSR